MNDAGRIELYIRWLELMVESDCCGEAHWCRELASLIAAAPTGTLRLTYEPLVKGSPPNLRAARWDLAAVVEHGLLAWACVWVDDGASMPDEVRAELVAVYPHVPSLRAEIDDALNRDTDLREAS